MPGLRRLVGSPAAGLRVAMAYRFLWSVPIPTRESLGPDRRSPRDCGSPPIRPDAASMRPSWPGCWPWNGSRVASWRSRSWISRSRRPGRSVGRCTGRSLGAGGSRPPGSRGSPSKSASVCWLLAGWNRSAEFELALDDWAEFGLSRFSASRGLDELERAGLVSVGRMPGRSPVVTILDVSGTNR